MKRILVIIAALCSVAGATPVTGHLQEMPGLAPKNVTVTISLKGCLTYNVRIGSSVTNLARKSWTTTPAADGSWTMTVPDETTLTCGAFAADPHYNITILEINPATSAIKSTIASDDYDISGSGTWDFALHTPRVGIANIAPDAVITNPYDRAGQTVKGPLVVDSITCLDTPCTGGTPLQLLAFSDAIDGENTGYGLPFAPAPQFLQVYLNGLPDNEIADYSLSMDELRIVNPPTPGDVLEIYGVPLGAVPVQMQTFTVPSQLIDGLTYVFTLPSQAPGLSQVRLNGQLLTAGADYSIDSQSGLILTLTFTPQPGDILTITF